MEFQQLRALLLVAETGSVTEAARRLTLTQPAVTRQVRALEDEFGGRLFDRTVKPITPTALGKSALEHARRILKISEELRDLVGTGQVPTEGRLRLGVVHSFARVMIPEIFRQLRNDYPGIQLKLTASWSGALRREVGDGLLDAAIVLAPSAAHLPSGLHGITLSTEALTLLSSARTRLRGRVPLDELCGSEWVLSREGCAYRAVLKRTLEDGEIPFSVAAEVHELDLLLHLVAEGVGSSVMASRLLPPHLPALGLQTFEILGVPLSVETRIIFRNNNKFVPQLMTLIGKVAEKTLSRANGRERTEGLERVGARVEIHKAAGIAKNGRRDLQRKQAARPISRSPL